ncbi:MAG: Periplasmic thiol:disulfide interchange protein DsbA [Myxococcaceae bacterium]|nr:Periplasmic thiol:disulfide interchange protein DsbA [Myxococcaceae bacterium]
MRLAPMVNEPSHDESFRREIEARVGRTLCQRYTLERVVGVGGTAAVYAGTHRNGNRVAIKVLHTELSASKEVREQFVREAYVANKVEHAGAVRILDDDTTEDGLVFLVMDLLEGQTLEEMIAKEGGRLSASELVPLSCQLLDVLAAAHAKGIVHRAVEPSNVFVTQNRSVRLMDFGTARLADGARLAGRAGRAMENAAYLAPEQARGETALVDAQTDLWATGAVMFRALSGRVVYPAETPEMVRVQAATQPAPLLRSMAPAGEQHVAEIVDRALAWKKDDRWKSAQAMATALRSAAHVAGSQPPPPVAVQPQPQPQQQQQPFAPVPAYPIASTTDNGWIKWVAAVAALMVLFTVGGGVALFLVLRPHRAGPGTAAKSGTTWSDEDSPVPVTSRDPMWGKRDAPVTIVAFEDFQCPFCARVETTLEQVRTNYGPDNVRIVWKNQPLPFHVNAKPAAEAGQVVFTLKGSVAFFTFHDLAFKNQKDLTPENFRLWAIAAGVDGLAYDKALATHVALRKVDEDQELAKKVGANGTPAFRINGVELSGAQPFDRFKLLIDTELAKASAKVANGTPKEKVYVVMSTENAAKAPAKEEHEEPAEDSKTVWRVPVDSSPIRGNVDAPVTIIEFGDFQCPFCKRAEQTIDKVRDTYGNKVRIVWKHQPLPFHVRAEPAAELALEARAEKGDAGFWRAHDKLFDSQPKLEDDDLTKIGAQLGLDATKLKTAINDKKHQKEIDVDAELGDDVQATGTPHFFVNGRRLVGAQPFEKFQKIIDEELRKFDDHHGAAAAKDYYASLMKDAKGAPEPEKKHAPPVPAGAPFRGGKDAKVVIQEWADFQCPFCQRAESTVTEIEKLYGDKVKIVWRDKPLPMHPDAAMAAELAREALAQKGQDGFWKMHDKLFANQQHLKRSDLDEYASELNLDIKAVARALDSQTHKTAIDTDDRIGTDIGISGTPAFLINSYYLSGAQPLPKFKKLIDKALAESR